VPRAKSKLTDAEFEARVARFDRQELSCLYGAAEALLGCPRSPEKDTAILRLSQRAARLLGEPRPTRRSNADRIIGILRHSKGLLGVCRRGKR
jgi:hypothetical protein